MKMNRIKFAAAVFTAVFALSGMTAFAQSNAPAETPTETVIEDNRTLTPKGNAQLIDDVSDNENLQFITVTARDGNVFYFVIDKGAQSENVYFLNTVDESDLEALVEKSDKKPTATATAKPEQTENTAETDSTENDKKNTDSKTEKTEQPEQNRPKNNSGLFIILALAAAAGVGGYYYKVILPKKKLEQADDLDDFDFEDEDTETVINEDDETDE